MFSAINGINKEVADLKIYNRVNRLNMSSSAIPLIPNSANYKIRRLLILKLIIFI